MRYANPWHRSQYHPGTNGPEFYDRTGCKVYTSPCGRGQIVHYLKDWHDYLINGKVVMQLVADSPARLEEMIGHILDGKPTEDTMIERAKETYEKQL